MSFPKHIRHVPEDRKAVAPYNFVELPENIVEAESLPDGDRYYADRLTGKIVCTLTTESPLYTRGGWSPKDFAENGDKAFHELSDEMKQKRATFFIDPATQKPIIPGSSLRGMFRTLIEIVSFSKIDRVSDHQRLFFRAVGSNPDKESWGREYKNYVEPKVVKAGYLVKNGEHWFIQPAMEHKGKTYAWVKESSLDLKKMTLTEFNDKILYEPQYASVSYTRVEVGGTDRAKRLFAHDVDLPSIHPLKGKLITSGNMTQGHEPSPRRNHCIVFSADTNKNPLQIDDEAIEHYRNALTDFQKSSPFDKDWGILEENRPVFYYHDGKSRTIGFFGQSPNFRIPYCPSGNGHATTVVDFIPEDLRETTIVDLADAIFGWVKKETNDKKLPKYFDNQRAGRIFITDALYESDQYGIWHENAAITPQILSEPKPTCFPHYLVQSNAKKTEVKHYASKPVDKTVIRGHKFYWHKGDTPNIKLSKPKKIIGSSNKISTSQDNKQTTLVKPLKKGVTFDFEVYFENLNEIELGTLLWVLDIAQDDQYRFSLGMGKPLGMGAVKITHKLYLSQREARYKKLFEEKGWFTGYSSNANSTRQYIDAFDKYICGRIGATKASLKEVRRIQMLLAMLSWENALSSDQTRYMEIERDASLPHIGIPKKGKVNEYADRPVLPTPLQVIGWADDDNDAGLNSNSSDSGDRLIRRDNTHVPSKQLSEEQQVRQEKINQLLVSENLEVGKQLEAVVLGKKQKGSEVTYEISGVSFKEKEKKQFGEIPDSGSVVVEIRSLNEDGSINHVKFIRKSD